MTDYMNLYHKAVTFIAWNGKIVFFLFQMACQMAGRDQQQAGSKKMQEATNGIQGYRATRNSWCRPRENGDPCRCGKSGDLERQEGSGLPQGRWKCLNMTRQSVEMAEGREGKIYINI